MLCHTSRACRRVNRFRVDANTSCLFLLIKNNSQTNVTRGHHIILCDFTDITVFNNYYKVLCFFTRQIKKKFSTTNRIPQINKLLLFIFKISIRHIAISLNDNPRIIKIFDVYSNRFFFCFLAKFLDIKAFINCLIDVSKVRGSTT